MTRKRYKLINHRQFLLNVKSCFHFLFIWKIQFTASFRNVIPQQWHWSFDDVLKFLTMIMVHENALISWLTLQTFQKVTLIRMKPNKFTEFSLDVSKLKIPLFSESFRNTICICKLGYLKAQSQFLPMCTLRVATVVSILSSKVEIIT